MKTNIRTNVIVNIVRTLVLTFLSFITFPWVCRYLKDSAVGLYTWANTFVSYFLILAKVGIPNLAVRECVKVRDNKELLSNKVQTFFIIQVIATIISFGLMCATVYSVPELRTNSSLIFILAINFLAGAFSFEWVFIALEKQFYMSVRSIISLALSAFLIITFVTTPSDIYIYAFLTILVTVTTTIINCFYIGKYVSFKKTMPYSFKELVKPLTILFLLSFAVSLYNQTDTFILGFLDPNKTEVASYSVGVKGIDIVIGVITALSTVFIPRANYYYSVEDKKYFNNLTKYSINICMFIVLPAIVTMSILSKEICGLISGTYDYQSISDSGYINAPTVLIILASMMLTYSLGDIIYGQVLLPMKKEKYYLFTILLGTLLNGALSIILGAFVFKENPSIGVAIGTVATDALIIIVLLALTWKWTKKAIFNKNSLKLILGNILLVGATFLVKYLVNLIAAHFSFSLPLTYIIEIISVIVVDAIIYVIFLAIIKEDLVYSFIRNKKEKQEII